MPKHAAARGGPLPRGRKKKSLVQTRLSADVEAALRLAAENAFTLAHQNVSLAELSERPEFQRVGIARLRRWCDEDGWDGKRQRNRDAWRQRAEARVRATFMQRHDRQMQMLAHLHDEAVRLRCQPAVQPRSWESVANVQLKAADMMRQWSKDHMDAMAQLAQPEGQKLAEQSNLEGAGMAYQMVKEMTDDDARVAAHAVLQSKLKGRIGGQRDDAEQEPQSMSPPVQMRRRAVGE